MLLLLYGYLGGNRFRLFRVEIIYPLAVVSVQWFSSYFIHSRFQQFELLLRALVGKETAEYGKVVRDFGTDASDIMAGLRSLAKTLTGMVILAFITYFTVTVASADGASFGVSTLFVVYVFLCLLLILNIYGILDDIKSWSDEAVRASHARARRFGQTFAVVIFAGMLAIPLVRSEPVLPSTYLEKGYEWLRSLTELEDRQPAGGPRRIRAEAQQTEAGAARSMVSGARRGDKDSAAGDIVRTVIIVVAVVIPAAILLLALIKPLLSGDRLDFRLWPSIKQWFADRYADLKRAVAALRNALRRRPRRGGRYSRIRSILQSKSGDGEVGRKRSGPAFLRRMGLPKELKAFLRVIKWGEKQGVGFRATLGPAEYADMVVKKAPEAGENLRRAALLLEVYLFSAEGLSEELASQYYENIELALKRR
jgi:hypothetical protein